MVLTIQEYASDMPSTALGGSRRRVSACVIALVAAAALATGAQAQWSSPFAAPGPDAPVYAMIEHDDGSGPAIYVGGDFRAIDGQIVNAIARYRNGVWSDLAGGALSGSFGHVWALTVFNGELVAAGRFSSIGGTPANNIAHWDGSAWHAFGSGLLNGNVRALAVYNGELVAAGALSGPDVVRWNGSTWQPMGTLVPQINALAVYNGELIAGGDFGPSTAGDVARWTGSKWKILGGGVNGSVNALATFNGDLIVSGWFNVVGGNAVDVGSGIVAWNGSAWQSLAGGLSGALANYLHGGALAIHKGVLIVGGLFGAAGGVTATNLAQWDGAHWSAVPGGVTNDFLNVEVSAILSFNDTGGPSLAVGGRFSVAGPICANNIARLTGGSWGRLSECNACLGLSGPARPMAVHNDGTGEALYVGGYCRCGGDIAINRIGRWDGRAWSALGPGFDQGLVMALAEFDDGSGEGPRLYAGGFFTSAGGVPLSSIAMWDGKAWSDVGGGIAGGVVMAMAAFDDGTGPALYVGGTFTSAGGNPARMIAKWNGRAWSEVGGGITSGSGVVDMLVWNDGGGDGLVIGGLFNHIDSVFGGLARWRDGHWSAIGDGSFTPPFVRCLAAWPPPSGSSLIVGGRFTSPGHSQPDGLAKWNGTSWASVAPPQVVSNYDGAWAVQSMRVGSCNQLFLTGIYQPDGGTALEQVWNGQIWRRLDGDVHSTIGVIWGLLVGQSFDSILISDFAEFQHRLYVSGSFNIAGNLPASNIAIWDPNVALACAADFNHDGQINTADLLPVISQWGPCANCTADSAPCGGDGQVNVDDLLAVIATWGACP